MSSEGTAAVAVVAVAAGGIALVGVAAVVGTGMLIAKGVMWCGKKMEENVEKARNEWMSLSQAAYAENRANVRDMPAFIADQAERIAAASAHLTLNAAPVPTAVVSSDTQNRLDSMLARVRTALESSQDTVQVKTETERELLSYQLKSEIESARGLLAPEQIGQAESALSGSEKEMRYALHMLQEAWLATSNAHMVSMYHERQARQRLRAISTQLFAVDTMLRNAGKTRSTTYDRQKQEIGAKVEEAKNLVDTDPERAYVLAGEAQGVLRALARSVSADTLNEWDQVRRKVIAIQATLDALTKMLKDAGDIKFIDERRKKELSTRIARAQQEAEKCIQSASVVSQQQLFELDRDVLHLKTEVFRLVKTKQQAHIAGVVATTLGELGFQSNDSNQPAVQENGDTMRIVAVRSGNTPEFRRDDKVVSFDVSRDGNLAYDFSGYVGDSCVSEAKEVFAALRAKGIFVLDNEAMGALNRLPAERLTPETLSRARFAPQPAQNKTQSELAERLKEVLERMKFSNIQVSVNGGCFDVEAFNGTTGYHVVLPSDGSVEVFKNHVDVSNQKDEVIVKELTQVIEEAPPEIKPERKPKPAERWQEYTDTSQKQMLDY